MSVHARSRPELERRTSTGKRIGIAISVLAVYLFCLGSAFAADKVKGKGVITSRSGDTSTVETADATMTITITPDTKSEDPIHLGARKKQVGPEVLIPELKVSFEGQGTDLDKVTAEKITFKKDDLTLAKVIQAGLNLIAQQQATNAQNIVANIANQQAVTANEALIETAAEAIAENTATPIVGTPAVWIANSC